MSISDPTLAEITMFGGNFAPRAWAFCDGQLLSIAQNTALFSLLGTIYGGDGRTTFGLPDLRGRIPLHPGNGPGLRSYRLGEKGGSYQHTLTVNEMPSHNHTATAASQMRAESRPGNGTDPAGQMLASGQTIYRPNAAAEDVVMDPAMVSTDVTVNNNGGNQSFSIQNPFIGVHFIIALQGTFPSRN